MRAEGGEGGAVCELVPFLFESAGNGEVVCGDGGVGELDAGEEVAHAGLDGRDAPVAVELGGDDRDGLVGVEAAHLLPLDLGDAGPSRGVLDELVGGFGALAEGTEDEADADAEEAEREEHGAGGVTGDAADVAVDVARARLVREPKLRQKYIYPIDSIIL